MSRLAAAALLTTAIASFACGDGGRDPPEGLTPAEVAQWRDLMKEIRSERGNEPAWPDYLPPGLPTIPFEWQASEGYSYMLWGTNDAQAGEAVNLMITQADEGPLFAPVTNPYRTPIRLDDVELIIELDSTTGVSFSFVDEGRHFNVWLELAGDGHCCAIPGDPPMEEAFRVIRSLRD